MSKLTEYSAVNRFTDRNDILIKDGSGGTKKIAVGDAAVEFAGMVSNINHRNVWRGKSLGGTVTSAQQAAIKAGTFDDLFIGDYWTISGVNYRIADMDYWYNCGDTSSFTTHHLIIVPDTCLISGEEAKMNDTDTTEGGYTGSKMYKTVLPKVKTTISSAFPGLLLKHRSYLVNAAVGGKPSAGGWVDSEVELMNEIMVYGCPIFTPANTGTGVSTLYTIDNSQLSLFRLNPSMIKRRINYWLRDIVSTTAFACVAAYGVAYYCGASYAGDGVRPVFAIGSAS